MKKQHFQFCLHFHCPTHSIHSLSTSWCQSSPVSSYLHWWNYKIWITEVFEISHPIICKHDKMLALTWSVMNLHFCNNHKQYVLHICCFLVFLLTINVVIITHKWWLGFYNWRLTFYQTRMYVLIYTLSTTADTWFFIISHTLGYTSQRVFSKNHAYTNIIKVCVKNCNSYKKK